MSDYQVLARLYSGLVGNDAVFRDPDAVETGAEGAQTTDHHCVLKDADDPSRQWTANQHRAYSGHLRKLGAISLGWQIWFHMFRV